MNKFRSKFLTTNIITQSFLIFLLFFRASFANVLLGAHQLYQYDDKHLTLKSTKFYIHPQYNASRIKNDIGLIELPEAVNFTSDFTIFFFID